MWLRTTVHAKIKCVHASMFTSGEERSMRHASQLPHLHRSVHTPAVVLRDADAHAAGYSGISSTYLHFFKS
jgi:hypothetical protein